MGTRHEQSLQPSSMFLYKHVLMAVLLNGRQGATDFHVKSQGKKRARGPLIFLRAGMNERLREAGPATWPPLGGDSVVFGSVTLGVSVSLARCQRGGGSNGDLVGRGPGGVPDSPRCALLDDSWAWSVRAWRRARLSTLRSPRRAPTSCPPPTTHFSN